MTDILHAYGAEASFDRGTLQQAVRRACRWLTDVAQVQTEGLTVEKDTMQHGYTSWKGAIRGEYAAATKQWGFFCPVWHTGQAVKALVQAYDLLGEAAYLEAARRGAAFIYAGRLRLLEAGAAAAPRVAATGYLTLR